MEPHVCSRDHCDDPPAVRVGRTPVYLCAAHYREWLRDCRDQQVPMDGVRVAKA